MHRPVGWLSAGTAARCGSSPGRGGAVRGRVRGQPGDDARARPACRGGLPLGTPGDDGSGIALGAKAGGATAFLDRVSVWRFLSPPPALIHGILVDRAGQRICDEARYGAAIGDAIVTRHQGRAWLLIDQATLARPPPGRGQTLWFQRLQAWYLLTRGRATRLALEALARRAGVDPAGLAATVAATTLPRPAGTIRRASRRNRSRPGPAAYSLIDYSVRPGGERRRCSPGRAGHWYVTLTVSVSGTAWQARM